MRNTVGIGLLCGLLLFAAVAGAQSPPQTQITEVEVIGALTVGASQVRSWSGLDAGKPFTRDAVATGIRSLFATNKFADIFVYAQELDDGLRLIINLEEFPRIQEIVFRGNKKVKDDKLREVLPISIGQFANPVVVSRELESIREVYYDKGYYNVAVHTDSSTIDINNLEKLVVFIDEGDKVKVESISFVGLENMDPEWLRGAMKQGTNGFFSSGTFKKQQFADDQERIIAECRKRGFLDATIEDVELNFRTKRDELDIVIHMDEGQCYFVGTVNWENNSVFSDLQIADVLSLQQGRVFNENEYLEDRNALNTLYSDQGYIYVTVEPRREIVDDLVNITYHFIEGEPAHVRNILILDNTRTHDKVLLRQLSLFPGDVFSRTRMEYSVRDIMQLGFFEDVQPDFRQAGEEGDIDLLLKVKEKQTGQFMFGAAYSAQTSMTGYIQLRQSNFRGRGQSIALTWQFGSRRRYVDLSFTEPWFRGTPMLVGADLFDRYTYNFNDYYESRVRGFSLRLGRRIPSTRFSRIGLRYELSETRLSNFDHNYVEYLDGLDATIGTNSVTYQRLDEVDWPRSKSAVQVSFSRNSTDNPFFPTAGTNSRLTAEYSGGLLGGEIGYQKYRLSHSMYNRLPGGFALHLRGNLGLIRGMDAPNDVPDYEKFRLGGNRLYPLRGYKDLEIVPRGNPPFVGGRFYSIFNAELLYPLTRAVQVLAFLDQGDVWNSFQEADLAHLRTGAGFGLRVEVPMMGNIGFDYGYGFDRLNQADGAWEFHFNMGGMGGF